jgi:hypothetical protein
MVDFLSLADRFELSASQLERMLKDRVRYIKRIRAGKRPAELDALCRFFSDTNSCSKCGMLFYSGSPCFELPITTKLGDRPTTLVATKAGWTILSCLETAKRMECKLPTKTSKKAALFAELFLKFHKSLIRECVFYKYPQALQVVEEMGTMRPIRYDKYQLNINTLIARGIKNDTGS